ncbi:MAG: ubiquinone/menaquinone biosynthesis C-methylase UbiE [Flavobacteriales bacterium]|jgi:ubiquinone/menaquinone biosynthesis C-methylase UbiE
MGKSTSTAPRKDYCHSSDSKTQAKVWDNIAPKWAEYRKDTPKNITEFLKDKTGKILDLGTGSGRNFIAFPNQEIYATDISLKMIEIAKEVAKEKGLNLIEAKVANANKQPFPDNTFDAILCSAVFHCIPTKQERQETIKEIYRTLKKEGTALLTTWSRNSPRLKNKEKECIMTWTTGDIKQERYTYIYDKEEFELEIKDAGFTILESKEDMNINVLVKK